MLLPPLLGSDGSFVFFFLSACSISFSVSCFDADSLFNSLVRSYRLLTSLVVRAGGALFLSVVNIQRVSGLYATLVGSVDRRALVQIMMSGRIQGQRALGGMIVLEGAL